MILHQAQPDIYFVDPEALQVTFDNKTYIDTSTGVETAKSYTHTLQVEKIDDATYIVESSTCRAGYTDARDTTYFVEVTIQ